jgi:hypothetical protein
MIYSKLFVKSDATETVNEATIDLIGIFNFVGRDRQKSGFTSLFTKSFYLFAVCFHLLLKPSMESLKLFSILIWS